jgi:hypothetical protein
MSTQPTPQPDAHSRTRAAAAIAAGFPPWTTSPNLLNTRIS